MGKHSILAPSGSVRWFRCAGSARAEYTLPAKPSNAAAEEGNRAHGGAALVLQSKFDPEQAAHSIKRYPNIEGYLSAIQQVVIPLKMVDYMVVERKMTMPRIHKEQFGTADNWFYDALSKTIHVWDFKNGNGPVYSDDNTALLCYGSGALSEVLTKYSVSVEDITFSLQICQFHIHTSKPWVITGSQFLDWEAKLRAAAENAMSDNPKFTAGDHCSWCTKRLTCPALEKAKNKAVVLADKGALADATDDEKAEQLRTIEKAFGILKAMESALKTELFAKLKGGASIPTCGFKTTLGNRKWADESKVKMLTKFYGGLVEDTLASPAQAEKKGVPKEIVEGLVTRPEKITLDLYPMSANDFGHKLFGE